MRLQSSTAALAALAFLLVACARTEPYKTSPKPVFHGPVVGRQAPPPRSNQDLAEIYAELAFGLESNQRHPGLRRFEAPVRIGFASELLEPFRPDAEALAARLRNEAEIDAAVVGPGEPANMTVHLVPRAAISREAPLVSCFVAYLELDWNAYISRPREEIETAELVNEPIAASSIYIPEDSTPDDIRTCLSEEILQGLGLGNDLSSVSETIFNDDNAHNRATEFDLQMLRLHYDPRLRSTMPEAEAKRAALEILDSRRPEGRGIPSRGLPRRHKAWTEAMQILAHPDLSKEDAVNIARQLEVVARQFAPDDPRVGFTKFTLASVLPRIDDKGADKKYDEARAAYARALPPGDVRFALIDVSQAIALVDQEIDFERAGALLERAIPMLAANEKYLELGASYSALALVERNRGRDKEALENLLEGHNWLIYALGVDYGDLSETRTLVRLALQS